MFARLHYYFIKHYKTLPALNVDPKAIQQINFTGNLGGTNNRVMFFIIEEAKETILDFLQGTVKIL